MPYNFEERLACGAKDECYGEDALAYRSFNPNPRTSKAEDCVKRAVVVATGMDYLDVEKSMNANKKDRRKAYNADVNYKHYLTDVLKAKKICMQVPPGTKRWHVNTIGALMKGYPEINYIMTVSKHLIGVRSGCIFDSFDDRPRDKGIYILWLFGATPAQAAAIQREASKGDTKPRMVRIG